MSRLGANTADLQNILEFVNALPSAGNGSGGVELPELSNPANADEIFLNKEVIDENGEVKTGTFTIDSELDTQVDLLSQLRTTLNGKAAGGTVVDDVSKAIIEGTITEIRDDEVKTVGKGVFAYADIVSASFPVCTTIGSYAFYSCSRLPSASFPVCTSIGGSAFFSCSSLTTASFPACTRIGGSAFAFCYSLTTVSFPVCTSIAYGAFYNCSSLTTVSFPLCTTISSYAFYSCCTLSSLTLGASTVCTLANSSAFSRTPYAGYSAYFSGTPYIYVPSSLVASYQTATNWTYFSSYITAMEV